MVNTGLFYSIIFFSFAGIGLIVFISLFFISAPYGRHRRSGWGPQIGNKTGWFVMEGIAPLGFALCYLFGSWKNGIVPGIFLLIWMFHYLYRAFIFPALLRGDRTIPLSILLFAVIFNGINSYLQGRYLYSFAGPAGVYTLSWLKDPRFIIGAGMFAAGFIIHVRSDQILRNLRGRGETGYKVPKGWLFRWISCPNYFGEMIEWCGWALLTWSIPGLLFALWTIFNLFPRALSHHRWYRDRFGSYPENRKAVIPKII